MTNDGSKESSSESTGATAATVMTGTKNKTPERAGKMGTRKQTAEGDTRPISQDGDEESSGELQ